MLNCAIIMGRLTTDPELKTTTNGISVTSFTVAVDRNYQKPGQERHIQVRGYEDRNGNKRNAVEIVADTVSFCGSKAETGAGGQSAGAPAPAGNPAPPVPAYQQNSGAGFSNAAPDDFSSVEMDDELPF